MSLDINIGIRFQCLFLKIESWIKNMIAPIVNRLGSHITYPEALLAMGLVSLVAERAIQWSSGKKMGDVKYTSLWFCKAVQIYAGAQFLFSCSNVRFSVIRGSLVTLAFTYVSSQYQFNLKSDKLSDNLDKLMASIGSQMPKTFLITTAVFFVNRSVKVSAKTVPVIAVAALGLSALLFYNIKDDVYNLQERIEKVQKSKNWIKSADEGLNVIFKVACIAEVVNSLYQNLSHKMTNF